MTAAAAAINRRRNIGRSPPCVNSDDTDYRKHRMRTVYMRSRMADERARNSRSMIPFGYYCFQCRTYWTDEDALTKI